jgi:hypothetical protein
MASAYLSELSKEIQKPKCTRIFGDRERGKNGKYGCRVEGPETCACDNLEPDELCGATFGIDEAQEADTKRREGPGDPALYPVSLGHCDEYPGYDGGKGCGQGKAKNGNTRFSWRKQFAGLEVDRDINSKWRISGEIIYKERRTHKQA